MRQSIARALSACLRTLLALLLPGTGQRRKPCHPTPTPADPVIPVSPWSRPWTSPSKEEAAELFRLQADRHAHAEAAWELRLQWERRRAATLATMGVDYPYTYEGAPFGLDDFRASA
ncbi:hypothetical protein IAG44_22440 [Streptomyces roseirectus]|uniref:Uncharacterized protein n=1 Tax=Streptomyces roseirectus TaxID=2768066 RepID=A0A7H0IGI1_9ACTN|nr:hypothetical protein [Streptomyces roseirectus]QNP71897.1 hypothetical protein IAG44_22440 [Streptomyces roseirectus]